MGSRGAKGVLVVLGVLMAAWASADQAQAGSGGGNADDRVGNGFAASELHAEGLSVDFYKHSCPQAHDIVHEKVAALIHHDPSEAAGLLRILFHDCFVFGCEASVLMRRPTTEQTSTPNVGSLRASSLKALDDIKDALEQACPATVSCADTISLSAAIAIYLVGGPKIEVATGRRDGHSAASNRTVIANIPPPTLSISALKRNFQTHGLDVADLVALSGAHTIGLAHCKTINPRISPKFLNDLKPSFAANLSRICSTTSKFAKGGNGTAHLDFISMDIFDNNYYKNVLNKVAIFHTDAALLNSFDTKQLVEQYAHNQDKFFEQFKVSMVKMTEMGVLTGSKGVIRKKCSARN